ncbi:hypothetical protein [Marinicella meishanensis]|uniref:hypothetical protein n=1 Tax=Marinicella meishanensis TaxID=2873263 RepID=UPI001CBAB5F1|nr:hypothetical protein [Marinicella sp. NBU2979]
MLVVFSRFTLTENPQVKKKPFLVRRAFFGLTNCLPNSPHTWADNHENDHDDVDVDDVGNAVHVWIFQSLLSSNWYYSAVTNTALFRRMFPQKKRLVNPYAEKLLIEVPTCRPPNAFRMNMILCCLINDIATTWQETFCRQFGTQKKSKKTWRSSNGHIRPQKIPCFEPNLNGGRCQPIEQNDLAKKLFKSHWTVLA